MWGINIVNAVIGVILLVSVYWVGYWAQNKPAAGSTEDILFYVFLILGAAAVWALIIMPKACSA